MNILDTNGISYIFAKNIRLNNVYYITPDVKAESEITELVFAKILPTNIREISKESFFDGSKYLAQYRSMLNKYRGRSFYNMTGFGDISILALLKILDDGISDTRGQVSLFREDIFVFTGDVSLRKKIEDEFKTSLKAGKIKIFDKTDVV